MKTNPICSEQTPQKTLDLHDINIHPTEGRRVILKYLIMLKARGLGNGSSKYTPSVCEVMD